PSVRKITSQWLRLELVLKLICRYSAGVCGTHSRRPEAGRFRLRLTDGRGDGSCWISRQVLGDAGTRTVVIDLRKAREITTAAFAHLVLLRRRLRAQGRDLHLSNLRGKAASLYQINRLNAVLPLH